MTDKEFKIIIRNKLYEAFREFYKQSRLEHDRFKDERDALLFLMRKALKHLGFLYGSDNPVKDKNVRTLQSNVSRELNEVQYKIVDMVNKPEFPKKQAQLYNKVQEIFNEHKDKIVEQLFTMSKRIHANKSQKIHE